MTGLQRRVSFYCAVLAAVCIIPSIALAVGPEDAEAWGNVSAISAEITSPANNTYLPINHIQSLTATASDQDCYRVGETWYPYSDDVTTGESEANAHIWWSSSTGEMTEDFGPSATYEAPPYSAGENVRDVTITIDVIDDNMAPDTYGYEGEDTQSFLTLKVWQVVVTKKQAGNRSINNDSSGILPAIWGGNTLGWVSHGNPAGSTVYYGKTELKGTVPTGVPTVSGFLWVQDVKGIVRHKTSTSDPNWVTPYDFNSSTWTDDPYLSKWNDVDSRHPNLTGPNVHEIFLLDAPGTNTGVNNNANIASDNWRTINFDADFRSYVKLGGQIISNQLEWEVVYTLVEDAGVWTVNGGHTP